jgi:hypothetical protein
MLKFNVGDRVGTVVIERGSAGNAFTGEMIRQLGEIMHLAAEQADIVTLPASAQTSPSAATDRSRKAAPRSMHSATSAH